MFVLSIHVYNVVFLFMITDYSAVREFQPRDRPEADADDEDSFLAGACMHIALMQTGN